MEIPNNNEGRHKARVEILMKKCSLVALPQGVLPEIADAASELTNILNIISGMEDISKPWPEEFKFDTDVAIKFVGSLNDGGVALSNEYFGIPDTPEKFLEEYERFLKSHEPIEEEYELPAKNADEDTSTPTSTAPDRAMGQIEDAYAENDEDPDDSGAK